MSRLTDIDALRKDFKVAKLCGDCPQREKDCHADKVLTRCQVCIILDDAPTIDVQPARQWISVKDRLPECGVSVLIYAKSKKDGKKDGFYDDNVITITFLNDTMYLGSQRIKVDGGWQQPFQYFLEDYEITHWMPLPEPPKENE